MLVLGKPIVAVAAGLVALTVGSPGGTVATASPVKLRNWVRHRLR